MEIIKVKVRREILQRVTADTVVHWFGKSQEPPLVARARSLDALERALRKELATETPVEFEFELETPSPNSQAALDARARATSELTRAAEGLVAANRDLIGALLIGPPAMSVRDIAKLLGVKRWAVHAVAMECAGALAEERARRRSIEREVALEARRAEARARLFAATGTVGGFYQRWKERRMKGRPRGVL